MYKEFYGLKESPFSISPDPDFMYWSQKHRSAFRHLMYNIRRKSGLILLTGEIGTGKTTLINALLREIHNKSKVATISSSITGIDELFQYILHEFALNNNKKNRIDYIITLKEFAIECLDGNIDVVLMLDEAQSFSNDILEEIRLLTNIETPKEKLIQIILVGQPSLLEKINRVGFEQVRQRIGMSYHLQPLSQAETDLYIRKRLEIAGSASVSLFQDDAIEEIFAYAKGIPRVINTVCDNALLFGAAEQCPKIDAKLIRQVVESLHLTRPAGPTGVAAAPQAPLPANSPEESPEGMWGRRAGPSYGWVPYVPGQQDEESRPLAARHDAGTRPWPTLFMLTVILLSVVLSGFLLARVEGLKHTLAAFSQSLANFTQPEPHKGPAADATSIALEPPPHFLSRPEPEYPLLAQRLGWEGGVTLDIELRPDGTVGKVHLVESSNYPILDEAAQQAAKKWTHVPAKRDGLPITRWITHHISFKLSERGPSQYELIRQSQERLRAAGFDPGRTDGVLGPRTKEALRKYQGHRGLAVTGDLDEATRQALGRD